MNKDNPRVQVDRACQYRTIFAHSYSFALVLILFAQQAHARICTSQGNGDWLQASTWSCGSTPTGGDTVIVQSGHAVQVTNNYNYTGAPLHIVIYGELHFNGGGSKLSLPCGSFVEIMPGGALLPDPTYNGFSETVRICNTTYWNTTMGPQTGYQIWPPTSTLPVELISFSGSSDGVRVTLEWVTATERDVLYFEVQRSMDLLHRVPVEFVPAAGNSVTLREYQAIDRPGQEGLFYYHLREVDTDGEVVDLGTIGVDHRIKAPRITCVPNPVHRRDPLLVSVPYGTAGLDVHLVGPAGRWMRPSYVEDEGRLAVLFDGLNIVPGIYTLQVIERDQVLGTCRFRLD